MTDSVSGVVAQFDELRGVGTITADDTTHYFFHCTQITDGSRSIAAGTPVTFDVRPGRRGRWEAAAIRPRLRS